MRESGKEGYVLVAVLGVMLTLTVLIASASLVVRSVIGSVAVIPEETKLNALIHGGIEIDAYQLFVLGVPVSAVDGRAVRLAGGTITPSIVDEAGKLDVNGADPKLLASVFQAAGIDAGESAKLIGRMIELRGPKKAVAAPVETPTLPGAAPASEEVELPQNSFRSIAEFEQFAGLEAQDAAALRKLLTVYNPDGKINVLTASQRLLLALPDVSSVVVEDLIAHRNHVDKSDIERFRSAFDRQKDFVKFEDGPAYTMILDARSATGLSRQVSVVVAAAKSAEQPFYILRWN